MTITASLEERVAALELVVRRLVDAAPSERSLSDDLDPGGPAELVGATLDPGGAEPVRVTLEIHGSTARTQLEVRAAVVVHLGHYGGIVAGVVTAVRGDRLDVATGREGVLDVAADRCAPCPREWVA